MEPGEELCSGGDDPLRKQPDCNQESEHADQEGDRRGHVVDDRPQGDEVDEDAGTRGQHLSFLTNSHHNPIATELVNCLITK